MNDFGGRSYPHEPPPTQDERNWAIGAHLSPLIAGLVLVAPLGPFVIYLLKKDQSAFVRKAALEALAFSIGWFVVTLITGFIAFLLTCFCGIGVILFPLVGLMPIIGLCYMVVAMVHASDGRTYEYPLTSGFVR